MTYQPIDGESWLAKKMRERGERAVTRQLEYQKHKSRDISGNEKIVILNIKRKAVFVRERLEEFRKVLDTDKILEVGSGAHGLIFGFDDNFAIGLDPLAVEYKELFPMWHQGKTTVAGIGESLPFSDDYFDLVLSDNVIDHAADPIRVVYELIRVLKPGGMLYFTVNTHHAVYQRLSELHGLWNALGVKYEISPFADHTVHFSERGIKSIFEDLPVQILSENSPNRSGNSNKGPAKGFENKIKRIFPKNILYELIALKRKVPFN